jgi:hypothetical protein
MTSTDHVHDFTWYYEPRPASLDVLYTVTCRNLRCGLSRSEAVPLDGDSQVSPELTAAVVARLEERLRRGRAVSGTDDDAIGS